MIDRQEPLSDTPRRSAATINRPLLSIVVVAWNNASHIEQALRSCIFATRQAYEVVVICPPSSDGTEARVDGIAHDNPALFRVVRQASNEGPGPARNLGVALAQGHYVAMLDGDDWFDPTFATTIMSFLKEEQPDVLVFNHVRIWPDGRRRPNPSKAMQQGGDYSPVSRRRRLVANLNVAWNKVYRIDFLRENGIKFSDGLYEDIGWHYDVLLAAKRYWAIPEMLIYYRQRPGSVLNSRNSAHFDMLSQFNGVLTRLQTSEDHRAAYGEAGYQHARRLLFNLVVNGQRLPRQLERDFLIQMNELLRRWRKVIGKKGMDLPVALCIFRSARLLRISHRLAQRSRSHLRQIARPLSAMYRT